MKNIYNGFEKNRKKSLNVRIAGVYDLPRIVDIDKECFSDVYTENPVPDSEIIEMFTLRQKTAADLMIVGEVDGSIEGFMTCQKISKEAHEINNWDETTDSGRIVGTHQENGTYFYVVNLTTTKAGSAANLSDILVGEMCSKLVVDKMQGAYLLSRIPQFSTWLQVHNIDFLSLEKAAQDELASQYLQAKKEINGKAVRYDGMLRRYEKFGVKPLRVISDGFGDAASHNYSVLCIFENPLPEKIRNNKIAICLASKAIRQLIKI